MTTAQKQRSEMELRVRYAWRPMASIFPGLIVIWTWALNVAVLATLITWEIDQLGRVAEGPRRSHFKALSYTWFTVVVFGATAAVWWYAQWPGLAVCLVVGAFLNDVAAMYVGRQFGGKLIRLPFAPNLSPNKTWEGALGGTVTSVIVAVVTWLVATVTSAPLDWRWYDWIGFGLAASVGVITGDLLGSALKRAAGVKDSGAIFGPQGGWLDRFGSHFGAFVSVSLFQLAIWCL